MDKAKQRVIRAGQLYSILSAYTNFYQMMLSRECSNINDDYNSAEKTSDLCNFFASMVDDLPETTPSQFMGKQDKYCNDAIEFYNEYKYHLDEAESIYLDRNAIESLCKHIYYGGKSIDGKYMKIKVIPCDHLILPELISIYISYKIGLGTMDDLRNFVWVDFLKPKKIDGRLLRRIINEINEVDRLYWNIAYKRSLRQIRKDKTK